jgi:hypothetical protein
MTHIINVILLKREFIHVMDTMGMGQTERNFAAGLRGSLFFFEAILAKIPEGEEMLPSVFISVNQFNMSF